MNLNKEHIPNIIFTLSKKNLELNTIKEIIIEVIDKIVEDIIVEEKQTNNLIQIDNNIFNISNNILLLIPLEISLSENWINLSKIKFNKNKNKKYEGPTSDSNWLILNKLLVGGGISYKYKFDSIKQIGIDTFVCLLDKGDKDEFYDYEKHLSNDNYIHFPIKDMNIGNIDGIKLLVKDIAKKILNGKKIYIHCAGGHGRTGIISSLVLHILYPELTKIEILNYLQYCHDQRDYCKYSNDYYNKYINDQSIKEKYAEGQVPTPQTTEQYKQIDELWFEV